MSFEGWVQCICPNGHYFTNDAYISTPCPDCGKRYAWCNVVDDTNCDSVGEIPMDVLSLHFSVGPDLFRVPTQEETNPLQHYRPYDGEKDDQGLVKLIPINTPREPKRGRKKRRSS